MRGGSRSFRSRYAPGSQAIQNSGDARPGAPEEPEETVKDELPTNGGGFTSQAADN
jgi:hypothetical protein